MSVAVTTVGGAHLAATVEGGRTVKEVLDELRLSAQVYIAAVNGDVTPLDQRVEDGDELLLIRMSSGG
jgi:sulfur carrier protein ThiS